MNSDKINQILRIAKMYYELNLGQNEIAEKEGVSKSSISRSLKAAKELGLVEVRIKEPLLSYGDLESQFLIKFPLRRVILVPDLVGNHVVTLNDICSTLADDLPKYIDNGTILGVCWGRTLETLSKALRPLRRQDVSVIQLAGGYSRVAHETGALRLLSNFAAAVSGTAYVIPAPGLVDTPEIARAIMQDSQIRHVLDMAARCTVAVYSVGSFSRPSSTFEMGLLTEEQYREMGERGCVGDCCTHFLRADGSIFDEAIDARTVCVSSATIKAIRNKILVATGAGKAPIIAAALRGGYGDYLYIDVPTAVEVMKYA